MLPASEFSTGTTPWFAVPPRTASKTAANEPHCTVDTVPNMRKTASSPYAPGSPWYATRMVGPPREKPGPSAPNQPVRRAQTASRTPHDPPAPRISRGAETDVVVRSSDDDRVHHGVRH